MPTRVLEHRITLGGLRGPLQAVATPPGLRVVPEEEGIALVQEGEGFSPVREHVGTALAAEILSREPPGTTVVLEIRVALEIRLLGDYAARRFFELLREHFPKGSFSPSPYDPLPEARFVSSWGSARGRYHVVPLGPLDIEARAHLEWDAAPAPQAAARLRELAGELERWLGRLREHGYAP